MPVLVDEYNQLITRAVEAEARAERLAQDLAALRQVARGYCPACGRGDCAPTVADWEQQRKRADQAEARAERLARELRDADDEHLQQAHHTDQTCEAVQRRDQAEAALERVAALADECETRGVSSGHPLTITRIREALTPEPAPAPAATRTAGGTA